MTEAVHDPPRRAGGWAAALERRETLVVCGVVLLGLAVRLLHFVQIEANDPYFYFPSVDPRVYHEWATRIAGGDWIGKDVFFLSPLYPYALAVLYKITGPSLYAARLVQLAGGAGCCALVYLLGKRTLGAATGAIAAVIWALYAPAIFHDGDLLVSAVQTPLNLLLALAIVRASSRRTPASWALAGALLGLSALARPNVLLLLAVLLPWLGFSLRGRLPRARILLVAAAFTISTAAVVLPATIRNYAVGEDVVLVSAQGGANFYIGNGPGATGVFRVPEEFPATRADDPDQQRAAYERVAEAESGRELSPSEVSDFWWRRTWSHVSDHPGAWLRLLAVKLGLFFNEYEPGNSGDLETSRAFSAVLRAPLFSFAIVSPLALVGMALAWRRRADAFPLYAMVATYAVSLVLYFVLAHYRMPVAPFLVVFAAYAVAWILERARARRLAALAIAAAGIALAVVATRLDLVDETGGRFIAHYNLGNKYRQLERPEEAIAEYERSIAQNPDYISSQHNLALLAERTPGHRERAIAAWERVLELGMATRDAAYVERARRHLALLSTSDGPRPAAIDPSKIGLLDDGGCEGCNVLLVTLETLRADHLKCQGYAADPAPSLCAFGKTALLFENAYTPAPITAPALQAILSGRLASNEDLLELIAHNDTSTTLPAELRRMGYTTAAITDHKGLGDLEHLRPKSSTIVRDFAQVQNFGEGRSGKTSAAAAEAVQRWLSDHRGDRFFLWTHLFDPHYNWVPAAATARAFGFDPGSCGRVVHGMDIEEIHRLEDGLSPAEIACLEALYHAEVLETDRLLGDILRRLDELGLAARTIVVIAGDHGEEFAERGHVGHELTLFDELLHVPFMVRNPASGARGRRAEPVSTIAIHDYLLAAVLGRNPAAAPPLVSRTFHYYGDDHLDPREFRAPPNDFSLVRGRLKLVLTPREGRRALYDLAADPGELRNLWGERAEGAAMAAELEAWLRDHLSAVDPASTEAVNSYIEMIDRLKALGYTR